MSDVRTAPQPVTLSPSAADRIAGLRAAALALQHVTNGWPYQHALERATLRAEGLRLTEGIAPLNVRLAEVMRHILANLTPVIQDGELIVGLPVSAKTDAERQALAEAQVECHQLCPFPGGMTGHMTIDEEALLSLGVNGLLRKIDDLAATLSTDDPRQDFYRASRHALEGILIAAERYRARAEEMGDHALAETLTRVPAEPARTFREALQSHYFVVFCLHMESFGQLYGRVDRWAFPYYQASCAAGMTDAEALELLSAYYIKINELHGTWPTAVLLGGQDVDGNDVTNALTWLCLDAIDALKLVNPSVALSCHPDTPPALLRRGCELLLNGHARPAFFNDRVIVPGMMAAGCTRAEAVHYVHSSCVEMSPGGCSNVWVASPYLSLLLPLEWVLNRGKSPLAGTRHISRDLGTLEQFTTFEAFFDAYTTQLAAYIRHEAEGQIAARRERFERNAYPQLSCFVRDCLSRGLDIDQGGARHNWVLPSHVGLANVVDSLAVIRELVYRRKSHSLADIRDLLQDPSRAAERQLLARSITPYGNDCAATDELAKQVTNFIVETYRSLREPVLDSTFHPGYFCWIMHEQLGRITGASPDGRPAGAVLADGSGAAQGRDRGGPTAAINSATSWEHSPCLGGIAVNLKFTPETLRGDAGADALLALVQAFLEQGGFELQVNVVDAGILREAQAHPEQHRDLVVRVAGFSEYFTLLSPAMQDEVISRTAHEC